MKSILLKSANKAGKVYREGKSWNLRGVIIIWNNTVERKIKARSKRR